ncbi:MAG: hypothetical protein ACKOU6_05100, partial [Planctomycetota bacterium]
MAGCLQVRSTSWWVLAVGLCGLLAGMRPVYADEPIKHSFFIAGPSFTGIIDEEGKEGWNAGRPAARDGY